MLKFLKTCVDFVVATAKKSADSVTAKVAAVAVPLALASASARAELPASVATALAGVEADATSLFDVIVPIVVAILGMMITVKLIKRFGNKI